jgi:methyl-accepting chemotaxis protein
MISFLSNQASLRKKIIGLALIPVLVCSIIFGLLIWYSSIRTGQLVGAEFTNFMLTRTRTGSIHGYKTATTAYDELMAALAANSQTVHLLLDKQGGIKANPAVMKSWQAVNEVSHETTSVSVPAIGMGSWQASPNDPAGPLRGLSDLTRRDMVLFERMNEAGDMLRVAEATPRGGSQSEIGTYLPALLSDGDANPIIQAALAGNVGQGRSYEFGSWHSMLCDPLRGSSGSVYGILCLGVSENDLKALIDEIGTNVVGPHGSAAIFYARGRDAGKVVLEPKGDAKTTEDKWLPIIVNKAQRLADQNVDGTVVHDDVNGEDITVNFTYIERLNWCIAIIANSTDLSSASHQVGIQFRLLLWEILIAALLFLLVAVFFALRLSKKLIDPMADLTIRLTSNATQIASSARQQAANVANINTSGNEIAAAVKEISATSKELLRSMEQLADDAEKTSEVANEGSRGLQGLGSSMTSLSTATHSITDQLTMIRTKANKINSVVTAITKVADQTNLLSLNAAIEAEKAGEGGAGFAVVAREIRRLADQSALATMEIEQMVEAMQEAVSNGVAQTRELTEAMERGIEASESISGQFGDIIQRVESMVPRYEAVHEGMQNQSEGAQQISEAMWQLTEMGRQTSESVNDLNDVSHQLHEAVRILKEKIIHTRSVG